MQNETGSEPGCQVVSHTAETTGKILEAINPKGFENIKNPEECKARDHNGPAAMLGDEPVAPAHAKKNEGHRNKFIQDYHAGIPHLQAFFCCIAKGHRQISQPEGQKNKTQQRKMVEANGVKTQSGEAAHGARCPFDPTNRAECGTVHDQSRGQQPRPNQVTIKISHLLFRAVR